MITMTGEITHMPDNTSSREDFFDGSDFWTVEEEDVVERPLSLFSNMYSFDMSKITGLEVHDRDHSRILSQDDLDLLPDRSSLSDTSPSSPFAKDPADNNIQHFTCKCHGSASIDQQSGSGDPSARHPSTNPPIHSSLLCCYNASRHSTVRNMFSGKSLACRQQLYETLPSGDAFRIVEILPGLYDDPVICRLHVTRITDAQMSYSALSYTWTLDDEDRFMRRANMPPPKESISCNGFDVSIGKNLFQAFRRIRQPSTSEMIWADALCINQEDVRERTQQVRKMSSIYKNAFRIVVWLGENNRYGGDPCTEFSGLCRIVNRWRERGAQSVRVPRASYSSRYTGRVYDTCDEPLDADDDIWSDIHQFYNLKWFRRVWVLQEIALARSSMVLWGTFEINWEWIGLAAAIIRVNYPRLTALREDSQRVGPYSYRPTLNPRAVPTGILNAYFMYRISRSQVYFEAPRFIFHQLLTLTRQFKCKDPRDQIFGILGIPTTDQSPAQETPFILPDYTKSIAEVYQEVANRIIDSSGSLKLLSSIQRPAAHRMSDRDESDGYDDGLPSWVPQWRFLITETLSPMEPSAAFDPAGGQPTKRKHDRDAGALVIRGIEVDKISFVNRRLNYLHFTKQFNNHDELESNELQASHYLSQSDLEYLALTLTAGRDWYGLPVHNTANHLADFAKCLLDNSLRWSLLDSAFGAEDGDTTPTRGLDRSASSTDGASGPGHSRPPPVTEEMLQRLARNGRADRFRDSVATTVGSRALFTTASGLRGIGPETMDEGDVVCVLYGANVPYVLRRHHVESDGYRVIGECYVHEIMRGEMVQRLSQPDSGVRETWIKLV
ncbi:heterokaryon incompatibility protein-domain-containing protein [Nemania sp. NC0429]|nr:heterokaryon incompatibility protein-domain-containing protein [Nemania sp. NC0429]